MTTSTTIVEDPKRELLRFLNPQASDDDLGRRGYNPWTVLSLKEIERIVAALRQADRLAAAVIDHEPTEPMSAAVVVEANIYQDHRRNR